MSLFYAVNSTKISHQEYWWGSKSPLVIIGWLTKWLRIRLPSSTDDPNTESTLPFVVEALPAEIAVRFLALETELLGLGFQDPVYHLIDDPGTETTIYWATFRHSSGEHFARIHHRVWQRAKPMNRALFPMFFSEFSDGTFLVSSSGKPDMAAPGTVQMNRMKGASVAALWTAHQNLATATSAQKALVPILSREELLAATERHHVPVRDFHLARGVFCARSVAEQSRADAYGATVPQARAEGLAEHAEVFAELERLQTHKPGWGNAFWILVGTLVAFVAAGASQWKWQTTLWLLPVLFFHEAGHWLAMRIFKYRNLRMFFIPFFGAAVSGQNRNVPGWKKVLVSLAGPVPGIAVGVVLATCALLTHLDWLSKAALMLLFVNGFNLLPFLPFDGGHVFHATLFCRTRWLDIVFRALAVCGLVALSFLGMGRLFMYIAIPLALGLPLAFKVGKVVDALRKSPLPPPLPGQDLIDQATAHTIITALKAELPASTNNKMLAQHTLGVYETLNARPPGVFATLGLLAFHGSAFLLVLVFCTLLVIGKYGALGDVLGAAARQPAHKLKCGQSLAWQGSQSLPAGSVVNHTVSTFKDRNAALQSFVELTNQLPATATLTLVGDSLVLALPADDDVAREHWYGELQKRSTNLFVALTNLPVSVSLTFVAPNEKMATNLTQDIEDYLQGSAAGSLIPPWSQDAAGSKFEPFRRARRNWRQLNQEVGEVWKDPKLQSFGARMVSASKRGAVAESKRLEAEQQRTVKELQDAVRQRWRDQSQDGVTSQLVDLQAQFSSISYTNRAERQRVMRELAKHLGELPREGDRSVAAASGLGAFSGIASQHGLLIEIRWLCLTDPARGLPALVDWLCEKGCIDFKYDIIGSGAGYDEDE